MKNYFLLDFILASGTAEEYLIAADEVLATTDNIESISDHVSWYIDTRNIYSLISKSIRESDKLLDVCKKKIEVIKMLDRSVTGVMREDFTTSLYRQVDLAHPALIDYIKLCDVQENPVRTRVFFRHFYSESSIPIKKKKEIFTKIFDNTVKEDFCMQGEESAVGSVAFLLGPHVYEKFEAWLKFNPTKEYHRKMLLSIATKERHKYSRRHFGYAYLRTDFLENNYKRYMSHYNLAHTDVLRHSDEFLDQNIIRLMAQDEKKLISGNINHTETKAVQKL